MSSSTEAPSGTKAPAGVLLMSFGSAATSEEMPDYLARVRGGKPAPDELVQEFRRRYELIGGSPLIRITREQASTLERQLNSEAKPGQTFLTTVGMRFSEPSVAEGLRELANAGARRIAGVIMSPQYSPIFMGGYLKAVEEALPSLPEGTDVSVSGAWHEEPLFIEALTGRVRDALAKAPSGSRVWIIMTVHSLPKRMVDSEPDYLDQLRTTAASVARAAGLAESEWEQAYQSAGHSPAEWLKPDFKALLPAIRQRGYTHVLVVPIQFLADHLETLYDIGIAGREEAESSGLAFLQTESSNSTPEFIRALAAVTRRELTKSKTQAGPGVSA